MSLGSPHQPLRVAIVGAGPAGFFAIDALHRAELHVKTDLFEALPAPYGLVRYGVAPDHPQLKKVVGKFDKIAGHEAFSYFGNVRLGADIRLDELQAHYDAVILSTGAPQPKTLWIDGAELPGVVSPEDFINWYNGMPGTQDRSFDLSCETAVIIGNGNVALDAARVLCHSIEELSKTDITAHALEHLKASRIKTVYVLGRRGPVQASFTHQEITELEHLEACDIDVEADQLVLSETDQAELADEGCIQNRRFIPVLEEYAKNKGTEGPRRMVFRFLTSPTAIEGEGKVERVVLEKNRLEGAAGAQKARGTGETFSVNCGLVIPCLGYKGRPIEGVPFDEQSGRIPNEAGRVEHGLYVSGWIKRGADGVIGSNKPDSVETVNTLLGDIGGLTPCPERDSTALRRVLVERGVKVIDFADWKKIDAAEVAAGEAVGKPREKFVDVDTALGVLD